MVENLANSRIFYKAKRLALFAVVAIGLILSSQVIFGSHNAYAAGCSNSYKDVKDCAAAASWASSDSIVYGGDNFKLITQNTPTTESNARELGSDKIDRFRFNNNAAILIPAGTSQGTKTTGLLVLTNASASTSATNLGSNVTAQTKKINIYSKEEDIPEGEGASAEGEDTAGGDEEDTPVCTMGEGMGWLICPAATFAAKLTDGAFMFLSALLTYESLAHNDSNAMLEKQWALVRNLANVAFAIAFLAVVYSTMTNIGINNYNLKRMVPRLVVAAVLVNASFWLCTIAVDISNIVGNNISGILESAREVAVSTDDEAESGADLSGETAALNLTFVAVTASVLAYAQVGNLLALQAFLVPILFASLSAIWVVVVLLVGRQALITLLVIISPLAFVAYVLPNTSKWFDRWRSIFTTMLMIFPIVALVFSGAKLASTVVRLSNEGDGGFLGFSDGEDILIDILSLGIQALPLFAVPAMLKSMGGVLNRIGAFTNDKTKGLFDRGQNKIMGNIENKRKKKDAWALSRGLNTAGTRRLKSKRRATAADQALGYAENEYHNRKLLSDERYLKRMSGGDSQMAAVMKANAASAADKQEREAIDGLSINYTRHSADQLRNMLNSGEGSDLEKAAMARQLIMKDKSAETMSTLDNMIANGSSTIRNEIGRGDFGVLIGQGQKEMIKDGKATMSDLFRQSAMNMSPHQMVNADSSTVQYITHLARNDRVLADKLQDTANRVYQDPTLVSTLGKNTQAVTDFRSNVYNPNGRGSGGGGNP